MHSQKHTRGRENVWISKPKNQAKFVCKCFNVNNHQIEFEFMLRISKPIDT